MSWSATLCEYSAPPPPAASAELAAAYLAEESAHISNTKLLKTKESATLAERCLDSAHEALASAEEAMSGFQWGSADTLEATRWMNEAMERAEGALACAKDAAADAREAVDTLVDEASAKEAIGALGMAGEAVAEIAGVVERINEMKGIVATGTAAPAADPDEDIQAVGESH